MTWLVPLGLYATTFFCCSGAGGGFCGRTATGTQVAHGTIAADPRVLPYGTRLSIPGYGEGTVRDTGSFTGKHIDLFYDNCADGWRNNIPYREVYRVLYTPAPAQEAPPAPVPADYRMEPEDVSDRNPGIDADPSGAGARGTEEEAVGWERTG